jgi:hypothetical protein
MRACVVACDFASVCTSEGYMCVRACAFAQAGFPARPTRGHYRAARGSVVTPPQDFRVGGSAIGLQLQL